MEVLAQSSTSGGGSCFSRASAWATSLVRRAFYPARGRLSRRGGNVGRVWHSGIFPLPTVERKRIRYSVLGDVRNLRERGTAGKGRTCRQETPIPREKNDEGSTQALP